MDDAARLLEMIDVRMRSATEGKKRVDEESDYWTRYVEALKTAAKAWETVLELERERRSIRVNGKATLDPEGLRQKSIREVLIEIAARNRNVLITKDAISVLVAAGIVDDREQARNVIYSTLSHSKRWLKKERPGRYRLTPRAVAQLKLEI